MQAKKPSLKGAQCTKYLGHFAKDKHIQAGHNTIGGGGIGVRASNDSSDAFSSGVQAAQERKKVQDAKNKKTMNFTSLIGQGAG